MSLDHPGRLIALAIFLLLFGFVMPFLIVLEVVRSTFLLNFLSFGASVLGLFLGVTGITAYRGKEKKNHDKEHPYQ
ncbi:MAG TPA: hypothetical protein VFG81_09485 [Anaerolineales bacterium]|nr:hypothetical protein [Anaerolineales bacterium]